MDTINQSINDHLITIMLINEILEKSKQYQQITNDYQ